MSEPSCQKETKVFCTGLVLCRHPSPTKSGRKQLILCCGWWALPWALHSMLLFLPGSQGLSKNSARWRKRSQRSLGIVTVWTAWGGSWQTQVSSFQHLILHLGGEFPKESTNDNYQSSHSFGNSISVLQRVRPVWPVWCLWERLGLTDEIPPFPAELQSSTSGVGAWELILSSLGCGIGFLNVHFLPTLESCVIFDMSC